ncbi:mandelate racemase [Sphingobium sp. Leaf26]|uniref:dipeptide epimerase n=1 Tax=Sphingobium sp. Leaf26 TaxID=1735693 RepID=UPI0006F3140B|nr:dipeptide epimerase [Sphingobium sp. Leaf26]KQM97181.1 mandelate racemase [Sphingobium sp. Leaf26]
MERLTLAVTVETLALADTFRISGRAIDSADVIVVTLDDGDHRGRGEAAGVYYMGDDIPQMLAMLDLVRPAIEAHPSRMDLRTILPPGGARNAVDAALWDMEAQRTGRPVWHLAGLPAPSPLRTTFTIGADDPARMAAKAQAYAKARSIKVKLTGDLHLDIARVMAIRAARPDVWLGVDANQGFAINELDSLCAAMVDAKISLIEQPLPRGQEASLEGLDCPIPLAADESALTLDDVAGLTGRFDVFNIKLDKCGGLTEGLMIADAARQAGLGVMVGCMVGSSLAMAPAFLLGQVCDLVDLDGPLFLAQDRTPALVYNNGLVHCGPALWGG